MGNTVGGFIFLAIIVVGVYVLPGVVATFAGSHSMEVNTTNTFDDNPDFYKLGVCFGYCHEEEEKIENFPRCTECHPYILAELNATALSRNVLSAHTPPAQQTLSSADSDVNYACIMCHHPPRIDFTGSHTKVGVVPCTYCHGNSTDPGIFNFVTLGVDHPSTITNKTAWVGPQLANSADMHSNWFKEMEGSTFDGPNANFTTGFYVCMACHTHIGMNMKISRPQAFNINITRTELGISIGGPVINYSTETVIYAQRAKGSVWR